MDALKDFRLKVVRYTLVLTIATTAGVWFWSPIVAKGALLGGIAGTIGFWITGKNVQKLASPDAANIQYFAVKWTFVRLLFYALAIFKGHTLDREHHYGLIAAVVGIFFVQIVMIIIAFTGLNNTRSEP